MRMRMIIIGSGGSGKTWLAGRLAEITRGPVVHLRSEADVDKLVAEVVLSLENGEKSSW